MDSCTDIKINLMRSSLRDKMKKRSTDLLDTAISLLTVRVWRQMPHGVECKKNETTQTIRRFAHNGSFIRCMNVVNLIVLESSYRNDVTVRDVIPSKRKFGDKNNVHGQ